MSVCVCIYIIRIFSVPRFFLERINFYLYSLVYYSLISTQSKMKTKNVLSLDNYVSMACFFLKVIMGQLWPGLSISDLKEKKEAEFNAHFIE